MRYRVGSLGAGPLEGDYVQLDLASIARGLGATVFAAGTRDEVLDALARARETDGPVVIVVPTAPHENLPGSGVWWDVAPAAVSSQPWLEEKREASRAGPEAQGGHVSACASACGPASRRSGRSSTSARRSRPKRAHWPA